jgi:chromate transporter
VVGVIFNLALFFAWHVYWPQGWNARFEWPAALIGSVALYALLRWQGGVIRVIAASAMAGLGFFWMFSN